mgnify:CR=1 FL=1
MLFDATMQAFGEAVPETTRFAQRHEKEAEALKHIRGEHVLLVEDNEINQELVLELLVTNGINGVVVDNGLAALEILADESFDGDLLDCELPIMDG